MIAIPYSSQRDRNLRGGTRNPCLLCGREVKPGREGGYALVSVEDMLLTQAEADAIPLELNQGGFPVGSECWAKVPAEYRS